MDGVEAKDDSERIVPLNICRCCLTDGCYKDISNEYYWLGKPEVYEDILRETFNICISYQDGAGPSSGSRLICEECISKLRDASIFKKQVQISEKNFTKHLEVLRSKAFGNELKVEEIKEETEDKGHVELEMTQLTHDDDDDHNSEDIIDFDDSELVSEIKTEKNDEDFVDEDLLPLALTRAKRKATPSKSSKTRQKKTKLGTEEVADKPTSSPKKRKSTKGSKPNNTSSTEEMMKDDSLKIVMNSNISLFERQRSKFQCIICKTTYLKILSLKEHMETNHKPKLFKTKIYYQKKMSLLKADITDLKCLQCSETCQDVSGLRSHLSSKHNMQFHPVELLFVPFRIANEIYDCVLCGNSFRTYRTLSTHMHTHYNNFVCEACGSSFFCYKALITHTKGVHKRAKCETCQMMFESNNEKYKHRLKVHKVETKRYCSICQASFKDAYKVLIHMIEVHGKKKPEFRCQFCGKEYLLRGHLNNHVRSVHLGDKPRACTLCPMRFYRSTDLQRHERTHDAVKQFSCDICHTEFRTKDSMSRHMRRKHDVCKYRKVSTNS